jgi:hypothetical protein
MTLLQRGFFFWASRLPGTIMPHPVNVHLAMRLERYVADLDKIVGSFKHSGNSLSLDADADQSYREMIPELRDVLADNFAKDEYAIPVMRAKLQETARLAEREGWHGVVHWHRKKGVSTSAAQSGSATSPDKTKPITSRESGLVFLVSLVAFVGLLAWLSR